VLVERQLGSQYVLRGNLGRGAMGQVFGGTDKQGRELAFKVLHPELAADANMVFRFVQERRLLLSVNSPNVVRVVDLVVEGDALAIVMELVAGQDLRALLKRQGTLGSADACRLGAGIARGLAAIHGAGIVHRDIKPENVLISLDGPVPVPKVTDFGVSSLVDAEKARTTMLVGTPPVHCARNQRGGRPQRGGGPLRAGHPPLRTGRRHHPVCRRPRHDGAAPAQ
jgi:serine/threonine protein kinase